MAGAKIPSWRQFAFIATGLVACFAVSGLANYLMVLVPGVTSFGYGIVNVVVVPLAIGLPLLAAICLQRAELARRQRALNRLASHDPVTDLYRSGAFSTIVDRRREIVDADNPAGAFLVVHADHLSEVNRRYGLEAGDEALALIALAIRSSVRMGDVVGRIGATMFGVFLPGAEEMDARDIADRISASVDEIYYSPDGAPDAVSVRIGGVVFAEQIGFNDMFREAVERLYSEDATADSFAIALGALRLDTAYRH